MSITNVRTSVRVWRVEVALGCKTIRPLLLNLSGRLGIVCRREWPQVDNSGRR